MYHRKIVSCNIFADFEGLKQQRRLFLIFFDFYLLRFFLLTKCCRKHDLQNYRFVDTHKTIKLLLIFSNVYVSGLLHICIDNILRIFCCHTLKFSNSYIFVTFQRKPFKLRLFDLKELMDQNIRVCDKNLNPLVLYKSTLISVFTRTCFSYVILFITNLSFYSKLCQRRRKDKLCYY